MLASNTPKLGICRNVNALEFWHLRITKIFDKPEYYIGQMVFHRIKVARGEILHPVTVVGVRWNGYDWSYAILLPDNHPQFVPDDHGWDEVESRLLEPM